MHYFPMQVFAENEIGISKAPAELASPVKVETLQAIDETVDTEPQEPVEQKPAEQPVEQIPQEVVDEHVTEEPRDDVKKQPESEPKEDNQKPEEVNEEVVEENSVKGKKIHHEILITIKLILYCTSRFCLH